MHPLFQLLILRGRTGAISTQAKFHFEILGLRYQFIATNIITFVLKNVCHVYSLPICSLIRSEFQYFAT